MIPCASCKKGQTKQYSKKRIKQHKNDMKDVNNKEKAALCSHYFKEDHIIDYNGVNVCKRKINDEEIF